MAPIGVELSIDRSGLRRIVRGDSNNSAAISGVVRYGIGRGAAGLRLDDDYFVM
jgi:hypothetical protein